MKKGLLVIFGILVISVLLLGCRNPTCTDTDGGMNYFEQGTVTYDNVDYTDFCLSERELNEYFCYDSINRSIPYNCTYRCENGACVNATPQNCTDSDGGLDYFTKGECTASFGQGGGGVSDYCLSAATLRECYCNGTNLEYQDHYCPYCQDGACVNQTAPNCTDTDGGINYFEQGTVSVDSRELTDFCLNEIALKEYYCLNETNASKVYMCPYKCENGACINETPEENCTDTDGGINYFEQGTVPWSNQDYTDFCFNETTNWLMEYYCLNDTRVNISYQCEGNCTDGACIDLECAKVITLSEGEVETHIFGELTYEIEATSISQTEANLTINGETIDPLGVGQSYQIVDGLRIKVLSIPNEDMVTLCFLTD